MNPLRDATLSILDPDSRDEFERAEVAYQTNLVEAKAARLRSLQSIRDSTASHPPEVADVEREYCERVQYHGKKFAKQIRWLLESWKAAGDASWDASI